MRGCTNKMFNCNLEVYCYPTTLKDTSFVLRDSQIGTIPDEKINVLLYSTNRISVRFL